MLESEGPKMGPQTLVYGVVGFTVQELGAQNGRDGFGAGAAGAQEICLARCAGLDRRVPARPRRAADAHGGLNGSIPLQKVMLSVCR